MRWQKDARTKFDHLPPVFCRWGVSGEAFHLIQQIPQESVSPLPSRGRLRAALLQPGSKRSPHSVRRSSGRTPRTRSVRLSCGKYRASSGSNEVRASFAGGLEHKVLCQAFCERKRERKWFGVIILGIESSCDETAAAVVEDGRKVLSSVIASQVEEHKLYGGVVPELSLIHI